MKRAVLISGVTAIALAVTAISASAKPGGGERGERVSFEQLDTNGDGFVTMEELQARGEARFADTDTDGDGLLSAEEIAAKANRDVSDRVTRMIEKRDTNGDGLLSQEEMQPNGDRAARMFDRLDDNGDGQISEEEFASMKKGKRKGGRDGGGETENN
jgi:Ca2+-binding EF-hand superfamily protein